MSTLNICVYCGMRCVGMDLTEFLDHQDECAFKSQKISCSCKNCGLFFDDCFKQEFEDHERQCFLGELSNSNKPLYSMVIGPGLKDPSIAHSVSYDVKVAPKFLARLHALQGLIQRASGFKPLNLGGKPHVRFVPYKINSGIVGCPTYSQWKRDTKKSLKMFPWMKRTHLREAAKLIRSRFVAHQRLLDGHQFRKSPYFQTIMAPISNYENKPAVATSVKQKKVKQFKRFQDPVTKVDCTSMSLDKFFDFCKHSQPKVESPISRPFSLLKHLSDKGHEEFAKAILRARYRAFCKKDPNFDYKLSYACRILKEQAQEDVPTTGIESQSDVNSSHGLEVNKTVLKQENVAIVEQSTLSTNRPTAGVSTGFSSHSCASESQQFSHLTERWLRIKVPITWKTTDVRGSLIANVTLPKAAIVANLSAPNALPFLQNRYVRFKSMKIMGKCTANRFQVGSVQMSWMYAQQYMLNYSDYNSVYSASQRNHCIIDANTGNSGILEIPYWNLKSKLSCKSTTQEKEDKTDLLNLGTLQLRVLNPLTTPDSVANSCSISLFVSFEEPEFSGLLDRSIDKIESQMDTIGTLVNTTESLLHIVKPPSQMDNPPAPVTPIRIQNMASQSFSTMQGQNEPLRSLRTDPLAQTPGVKVNDGIETQLGHLLRRWSLLDQFTVKTTEGTGSQVWTTAVTPVLGKGKYKTYNKNSVDYEWVPVLAYLSSFFDVFHGGLEYRFDVVASEFHKLCLQVSQVPGYQDEKIDMDLAKNSVNEILDISLNRQFTFSAQYYNNVPFSRIARGSTRVGALRAPSQLFVHVVNPLIAMDNVSDTIEVNVYVRAGSNFELAIPRPPAITTPWRKIIIPKGQNAFVSSDWPQMFTSGSRWFPIGNKQALSFFDSETTDYFTQFINFQFGKVYEVPSTFKYKGKDAFFRCQYYKNGSLVNVQWFCRAKQYSSYPVAIIFPDQASAIAYAKDPSDANMAKAVVEESQGPWAQMALEKDQWFNIARADLPLVPFPEHSTGDWEFVQDHLESGIQSQMEEQQMSSPPVITLDSPAASTSAGKIVFGESINDMKDYCKRWQSLGCFQFTTTGKAHECLTNTAPVGKIHLHPIRVLPSDKSLSEKSRDNLVREGAISLLSSLFVGWRGGLRIRLVFSGKQLSGLNVMVEHVYNESANFGSPSVIPTPDILRVFSDFINTTYACDMQSLSVNKVLEIEIPFYKFAEYCYANPTSNLDVLRDFSSLGYLYIYASGLEPSVKVGVDVFYSFADDCIFSNFQGCPAIAFLEDHQIQSQGDDMIWEEFDMFSPRSESEWLAETQAERNIDMISGYLTEIELNHIYEYYAAHDCHPNEVLLYSWVHHQYGDKLIKCMCVGVPYVKNTIQSVCADLESYHYVDELYAPCSCFNEYVNNKLLFDPFHVHGNCQCVRLENHDWEEPCGCTSNDNPSWGECFYALKPWHLRPEMKDDGRVVWYDYYGSITPTEHVIESQMEYIKSWISWPNKLGSLCDALSASSSQVATAAVDAVKSLSSGIKSITSGNVVSTIKNGFSSAFEACTGFALYLLTNIMHIVSNPSKTTIFIVISSVFIMLFQSNVGQYLTAIKNSLFSLWDKIFTKRKQPESGESQGEESDSSMFAEFASLLWSVVGGILSYTIEKPKNLLQFTGGLFRKSGDMFRTHVFGIKFFQSIFSVFSRICKYFNKNLAIDSEIFNVLKDKEHLKHWLVKSMLLTDCENKQKISSNSTWLHALYEQYVVGKKIMVATLSSQKHLDVKLFNIIKDTYNKLSKLVDEFSKQGQAPSLRVAPYHLWLSGPPGIGKSTLINEIVCKLSTVFGVKPEYYNHTSGAKYYDNLTDQPFLVLDDFLCTVGVNFADEIAQYQEMTNSTFLSLPRADCPLKKVVDRFRFLIVTSNVTSFEGVSAAIKHHEALNRRRDLIIKFEWKDDRGQVIKDNSYYKKFKSRLELEQGKAKVVPSELKRKEDFSHVKITASRDGDNWIDIQGLPGLLELVSTTAQEQQAKAIDQFQIEYAKVEKALDSAAEGTLNFFDYFKKISADNDVDLAHLSLNLDWIKQELIDKYVQIVPTPSEKLTQENVETIKKLEETVKDVVTTKIDEIKLTISDKDKQEASSSGDESIRSELGEDIDKVTFDIMNKIDSMDKNSQNVIVCEPNEFDYILPKESVQQFSGLDDSNSDNIRIYNNPFKSIVNVCAHTFYLTNMFCFKLKEETRNSLKRFYSEHPPNYIFVQQELDVNQTPVAFYDCPCVDQQGRIITECHMLKHDGRFTTKHNTLGEETTKQRLSSWLIFLNNNFKFLVNMYKSNYDIDLVELYSKDLTKFEFRFSPVLFELGPKFVYGKLELTQPPVTLLQKVIKLVTLGYACDFVEVDGVRHKCDVNDANCNSVKITQRGLCYDTVTETKYLAEEKKTNKYLTLAPYLRVLATLGVILCLVAFILEFFDLIIWFLQFWNIIGKNSFISYNWGISDQLGTSGDMKTLKAAAGSSIKAIDLVSSQSAEPVELEFPKPQATSSFKGMKENILKNHIYMCLFKTVDGKNIITNRARCLGVYNHVAVFPTHYYQAYQHLLKQDSSLKFALVNKKCNYSLKLNMDELDFNIVKEGGLSTFKTPKCIPLFKNILKYMQLSGNKVYPSRVVLLEHDFITNEVTSHDLECRLCKESLKVDVVSPGEDPWNMQNVLSYPCGGKGMCGSLVLDPRSECPILGMHTSGVDDRKGFAELLLRDSFIPKEPIVEMIQPQMELSDVLYAPEGNHQAIGHLKASEGVQVPNKTKIIPSALFGCWENMTEPAPLSSSDERLEEPIYPLHAGVEKRCDPMIGFNKEHIELAFADFNSMILNKCKPSYFPIKPLSWNDTICGMKDVEYVDPMELKTSEGFPWVKERPSGMLDKRWMFNMNYDEYPRCDGMYKKLYDVLTLHEKMRDRMIVPFSIYTACLKDARIPKSKCSIVGKTRVFEMSPVELTLAQRKYFIPFYSAYQSCRMDLEHTIGINVNSPEWTQLGMKLKTFSHCILAGDYSSYGPKANIDLLHKVMDVHINWLEKYGYSKAELRQCNMLKYQILNAPVLIERYICRFFAGMPSGNAATVILNSGLNSLYIRLAWLDIMKNTCFSSLQDFHENVVFYSNGDDIILSVKDKVIDIFNNVSLSKFFAAHNLKYTNSKKDEEIMPYEKFEDVQYLKCCFRQHPFRAQLLAALDWMSVQEAPLWVWKSKVAVKVLTAQNIDQALRLAYGHGKEKFNWFKNLLLQHCDKLDLYVPLPDWDSLDRQVWDYNQLLISTLIV